MPTRNVSPAMARTRGRVAAYSRSRTVDDPEFLAAQADLATVKLSEYVARIVETAPPLTPAQRDRIAALLRPGGGAAND